MGCYIWYSEEGTARGRSLPRHLLTVPNLTAHPLTASVPITVLLYNGPLLQWRCQELRRIAADCYCWCRTSSQTSRCSRRSLLPQFTTSTIRESPASTSSTPVLCCVLVYLKVSFLSNDRLLSNSFNCNLQMYLVFDCNSFIVDTELLLARRLLNTPCAQNVNPLSFNNFGKYGLISKILSPIDS